MFVHTVHKCIVYLLCTVQSTFRYLQVLPPPIPFLPVLVTLIPCKVITRK